MTVEQIQMTATGLLIAAGVLFLVAVALFFLFNVPKVIGDVSGSTARKAIENIRKQNESTGNKAYRPSPINAERGKITDRITPSGRLEVRTGNSGVSVGTAKLPTEKLAAEASETTTLYENTDETGAGETAVLNYNTTAVSDSRRDDQNMNEITVEYSLGYKGSTEIIE